MSAPAEASEPTKAPRSLELRRYALAGLPLLAAFGVQVALNPIPSLLIPLLVSLLAVIATAYFAGRGPALFATAATFLVDYYFFAAPRVSFAVRDPADRWGLAAFAAAGIVVSLLSHRFSGTRHLSRVALIASSALLLMIGSVLVWFDLASARDAEALVEHTYQVLNASERLLSTIQDAEGRQQGYLLTGDEGYLERYREVVSAEQAAKADMRALTWDNAAQQARLMELDRLVNARLVLLERGISARRDEGIQAAIGVVRRGEGPHLMSEIGTVTAAVEAEEHRLLIQRNKTAAEQAAHTRLALASGAALLAALLMFAGFTIESDVSKLKASQHKLSRQAHLIDLSHDAIIVADHNRVITGWNAGARAMYGWTEAEALGKVLHQLLRTKSGVSRATIDEILSREGRWDGELVHTRADGTQLTTESRQVLLRDGAGSSAILEINRDITARKEADRILRRQADLLDEAHEAIFTRRLSGPIEYWNHGAEELYGLSRQEAQGRFSQQLLQTRRLPGMAHIEAVLSRDGRWRGELTRTINGREIIVDSSMTLVNEPDGRKTVLEVNRDITEAKRIQEEIRQLNQELEQRVADRTAQLEASNKELEAFAYSVSHDLRAPLRGIDGWSMALLEDCGPQLDQTANQYLERIRAETQRMGHLIDDLLKLSRLTRTELRYESVDLSSLARAIVSRLQEAEPDRTIDFEIQEGLAGIADARLLEVVLVNLLSNAVKFTGPRAQARIEFGQTWRQNEPVFYVRDNGVGFDMAYAGTLFGAFQRLHKYTEFPGTGIGLATAQRVLRRHGGKIWADARPNEGATFYFTIAPASVFGADRGDREASAMIV
jgi:PAS domain S-box-containing protein